MEHHHRKRQNIGVVYLSNVVEFTLPRLTLVRKQTRLTVFIPYRKCLNDAIDLLRFSRQAHVHEQSPQCYIQGIVRKVKTSHVDLERSRVEFVTTMISTSSLKTIQLNKPLSENIGDFISTDLR